MPGTEETIDAEETEAEEEEREDALPGGAQGARGGARSTHTQPATTVTRTTAVATRPRTDLATGGANAGMLAIAEMSDEVFELQLANLKRFRTRMERVKREYLRDGIDYQIIPGTKVPSLSKAGGESLRQLFHLVPTCAHQVQWGDGSDASPFLTIIVDTQLHQGALEGPVVGVGVGAANSNEEKWRYRNTERLCPACGVAAIVSGKPEYNKGAAGGGFGAPGSPVWLCFKKKSGCGQQYAGDDPKVANQVVGKEVNQDQVGLLNTIIKIAKKRSLTDATLDATASSGMFTQDLDESYGAATEEREGKTEPKPEGKPTPAAMGRVAGAAPQASAKPAEASKPAESNGRPATRNAKPAEKVDPEKAVARLTEARSLAKQFVLHRDGEQPEEHLAVAVDQLLIELATFENDKKERIGPRDVAHLASKSGWIARVCNELKSLLKETE